MARKQLDVNFFTPEAIADPYPLYEQIRETGEVVWNGLLNAWMVVDWELASDITTDNDTFAMANSPEFCFWFEADNIMTVDGDYHRRLRGALTPMFTRPAVVKWESGSPRSLTR
jgi:cytochrome P450